MGLSRNKVAVPEGVAGTPPFWSVIRRLSTLSRSASGDFPSVFILKEKFIDKFEKDNEVKKNKKQIDQFSFFKASFFVDKKEGTAISYATS